MSRLALMGVAPTIAKSQPKTAASVITLVRTTLLPLLPFILTSIIQADKSKKYARIIKAIHEATDI